MPLSSGGPADGPGALLSETRLTIAAGPARTVCQKAAGMNQALDRLSQRDKRADEDRKHDSKACETSPLALRKKKASPSGIAVSTSPKL